VGTVLGDLLGEGIQPYLLVVGGLLLIITVIVNVDGVVASEIRRWGPLIGRLAGRVRRRRPAAGDTAVPDAVQPSRREHGSGAEHSTVTPRVLAVSDIAVRFGVTDVLKGVSLEVRPGAIVGLIGPNGAGKTTLIDVITGYVTPRGGSVTLDGTPVARAAHARARAGIARSYQSLELFDDMTVLENLRVASEGCRWWNYLTDPLHPGRASVSDEMARAIEVFKLGDVLHKRPNELPYGQRRLVAIARAVAAEPSVLLLDEPAAGLSETERAELAELVRHLARDRGLAVLLIEHDVPLVMSLCEEVVALDFGRVIARGRPDEMRNDPAVIASYLGAEASEHDEQPHLTPSEAAGGPGARTLEKELHP